MAALLTPTDRHGPGQGVDPFSWHLRRGDQHQHLLGWMKALSSPGLSARFSMNSPDWKRVAILATGWLFIALGIAGLFLPFLQGILFLLIGLVILSTEYSWARRILGQVRTRFPKLDRLIKAAHEKASAILGQNKEPGTE